MAAWTAAALLSAIWLILVALAYRQPAEPAAGLKQLDDDNARRLVIRPSRYVLERGGAFDRVQPFLAGLHGKLLIIHGSGWTVESTRQFAAYLFGAGFLSLLAGAWLAAASGQAAILAVGLLVAVALPAGKIRETANKVEKRRQNILLVMPELLSKLMLLIGAGETVQRALARCAELEAGARCALREELRRANESVRNGEPFHAAMEKFSRRCAVQEVSIFTTTLLLNYRRGGDKLTLSLQELSYTLWEKRKAVARSRGEQASSKLVFPLVGVFLVLMLLVASPAILLMGN